MTIKQILVVGLTAVATITAVAQPINVTIFVTARALSSGPSIDLLKPDDEGAKNIANIVGDVTGALTGISMGTGDIPNEESALPDDVYDLPDDGLYSTPTVYDKPPSRTTPQYAKLTIGCRGKGCDSVVKVYDLAMPMPTHSCPRDALAALAKWRLFCDRPPKAFSNMIQTEPNCWSRAPSIDSCCGKWVQLDDPKYKDYPSRYVPTEQGFSDDTYVAAWVPKMGEYGDRRIIQPGWHEYNVKTDKCQFWRPEDDLEFAYFINTLPNYGIWDVDETGKIYGQTAYNAEGVSPGAQIPGSDSELDPSKAVEVE